MKYFRVLLIDTSENNAFRIKNKLQNLSTAKFAVTPIGVKDAEIAFQDVANQIDILLINETISPATIIRLAREFRSINKITPIFLLSKISEPRLSRKMRDSGVDGVVNRIELETPLSAWTFMSIIEHTLRKRKAHEYDILRNRVVNISKSLSSLLHDINNPLSVVRLAIYNLSKEEIPDEKKDVYLRLLINHLDKLDVQLKTLTTIKRKLNGGLSAYSGINSTTISTF